MDTTVLHAKEGRLEEGLGAPETLIADGDDLTVRKLIGLLKGRGGSSGFHLLIEVKSNIAKLLLDVADNLPLSGGSEGIAPLGEDLHEVVSKVSASKIQTEDGVREGITFIDGHGVRYTITRVHHNAGGAARGIEGKHGLDSNIHCRSVEGLKHDLSHLLPVRLGVEGSLSEEDRVFLGSHTELIVEGVVPDLLHVIPVGDDAMLDRVLQGEDAPLALGLVPHIGVLLAHAHHDTLVPGAANDGGEDCPGSIVASETGLAHTGAIVNHEGGHFF